MKQSIWFILIWINISVGLLKAQDAAGCMQLAAQQRNLGNLEQSAALYQRVLYFDRNQFGRDCYQQLADIYFQLKSYPKSEFYYDLVFQNAPNDSIRFGAIINKAGALILQEKFVQAERELLSLPGTLPEYRQQRKMLYLGAAYYGARDFDLAESTLLTLIPPSNKKTRKELSSYLRKARKLNRKNPKTARLMSMILPGSGQLYAGDFRNGLNSMGLNGVMVYWFIYTVQTATLNDALLSVGPWVFRYYAGGYSRAARITEDKKKEKLQKNFGHILSRVQQTIPGSN